MDPLPSRHPIGTAIARARLWFTRLPLQPKLTICIAIIFLPSFLLGCWISLKTYGVLSEANANLATLAAKNTIDTLDYLVFERYADAQVFSGMPLVKALDRSKLPQILDHLVTTYAPYYRFAFITDRTGEILAVSRIDHDGRRIPSSKLVGRSVAKETWFTNIMQTSQPVLVEDFHQNPLIREVFHGDDQDLVMGFHATIRNSAGQVVGVWTAYLDRLPIQHALTEIASAQSTTNPLPFALFNRQGQVLFKVNDQQSSHPSPVGLGTSRGFSRYKGLGWQIQVYPSKTVIPIETMIAWYSLVLLLILLGGGIGLTQSVNLLILKPIRQLNQKTIELAQTSVGHIIPPPGLSASMASDVGKTDVPNVAHRATASTDEIDHLEATFDSMSAQIQRHLHQTACLATATRAITETGFSVQAVLQKILTTAAQLTDARYAALAIFDESENALSEFHTIGLDETTRLAIGRLPKGIGLLGHINKQKNPLRLADLQQHPDSVGFPPHHPPMRSFLGQSIFAKDQLLGRIYLTDKQGAEEFSVEDERILISLTSLAGASIANAQLHERIRDAEARYNQILESTNEGILGIDLENRCTFINQAAAEMLGYEKAEVLGQPIHPFVCHTRHNGLPHPVEECLTSRLFQSKQPCHLPKEIIWRKDGTWFVAELASNPIMEKNQLTGTVVNFTDITQRVQAEDYLRASEERFRQLAETIKQVFRITTADQNQILYVSPAYQEVWGRTSESLYASPWSWTEAIHPDDRERIVQAAQVKQISGQYHEEYRIVRPDGSVRWILDRTYPVRDASGVLHRIIGLAQDITQRKELEEQLRHSQKMEAIGQFAGGIAHDFNNLLSVINGYSKILLAQIPPDDPLNLKEDLHEIWEAGQRASALTTQLLTLSRKQILQPTMLDLNRLIENVTSILGRLLGERIRIRLEQTPDTAWVLADQGQLEQSLLNLALNARDAMPHGGTLTIKTNIVHLNQADLPLPPGPYVTISVQDTGTGMSPEVLSRCFDPFFTTKGQGKGTGLGLAMVYGFVNQSKGHITATSESGHGTTFTIYLPQIEAVGGAEDSEEAGAAPIRTGVEPPAPQTAHTTVLLVEDEPKVLAIARKILETNGCLVLTARNAGEALVLSAQYPHPIHVLVSDITMPGMTGYELAERLLTARPGIRIVLMSGYASDVTFLEFLNKTAGCFLSKPFSPETLMAALADTLSHPSTQKE